ncbi:MAG TPA: hypothetical protein VGH91_04840 [Gammaproteobacteria bacterium]|jgi:hypothetical protein
MENLPIKLRASPVRPLLVIGVCLLCAGINTWASLVDHTSAFFGDIIAVGFALYFGIQLSSARRGLELNSEGLRVIMPLASVDVGWGSFREAGVGSYGRSKVVLLKLAPNDSGLISPLTTFTLQRYSMTRVGHAWDGWDAALPDNYGMKAEELAGLINRLKQGHRA